MTFGPRISILAAGALALSVLAPCLASADAQSRLAATVTDFHGKYEIVVRDERGRTVNVKLHPGTIINPAGLRLERGMKLSILGQAADGTFAAGEIDTAYQLPPSRDKNRLNAASSPNDFAPRPASNPADAARFGDFPGDRNAPRVPDVPAPRTAPQ
ncbi:MAG TPA: hypothetical protein VGC72_03515 [Candidatus Elarobacter sp.]|jgi:hypothetical protein